jgi:hypothetical protein
MIKAVCTRMHISGCENAERRCPFLPGTAPVPAGCPTSAPPLTCDNSAAGGTRTPDPLVRSQVLYPLSYSRKHRFRSQMLYPLSYERR